MDTDAAKKLAEEAPLWRNKLRADGSEFQTLRRQYTLLTVVMNT